MWKTSPSGSRFILWFGTAALLALTLNALWSARAWHYLESEAADEIAAYETETRATVKAGQKAARQAARQELLPKGPAGVAPAYPPPTRESMQPPSTSH